ncbi:MAG: O-linked N-acetylglucosamine transferase, SPINDLY family protein [Leptolyngbyaceae cyanobacterium RU_5_1]|nr:O-linked N-acetylglucosamine transferase, SPINDLY family protein [Leptolyngbyaceae cyanobacterium RU_5_1]
MVALQPHTFMNHDTLPSQADYGQSQAYELLLQGNYGKAVSLYECAIELEPEVKSHYWYLGLLFLLQGEEVEAQITWFVAMTDGEPEQIEQWTVELVGVLQTEAERRRGLPDLETAWVIRQHVREVVPAHLENLLHLVCLSSHLEKLTAAELEALGVIQQLQSSGKLAVDNELLLQALDAVLEMLAPDPVILELTEACLPHIRDVQACMAVVLPAAMKIAHEQRQPKLAIELLQLYLRLDENNPEILGHLAGFYQDAGEYDRGIEIARSRLALVDDLAEKVFSSHLVLRGLMSAGGYWQDALTALDQHEQLLLRLIETNVANLHPVQTTRLFTSSYFFPYFRDDLQRNRRLQNRLAALCQRNLEHQASADTGQYNHAQRSRNRNDSSTKPLKIGYLSHCMKSHSVGWLARWLLKYRDRDRFQVYGYFINDRQHDPLQDWYVNEVDQAFKISVEHSNDSRVLAERIYQDEIDILVDLDSLTLDLSCHILALKPAPIQVSWLGWDASGIPAIDYFIADPYVLPDWAQDYYSETIWRLPHTYIAVDGFEVGVPSLRRDQLDIPTDAIVYLSAQKGYKRHAETARLQMKIVKAVPNSYFLIKGPADQQSIQQFFEAIAESEGVNPNRLRFLPEAATEAIHRADLQIADVVLDTYPYNGATTTLETLWMGIPLVTRVGEQFAARNSYTMLMNVGVKEGIAWTDEEYVEWGVRLGKDESLRQQIHWTLKATRQTSPLWNAKQFTKEMENAYQQMCHHSLETR